MRSMGFYGQTYQKAMKAVMKDRTYYEKSFITLLGGTEAM